MTVGDDGTEGAQRAWSADLLGGAEVGKRLGDREDAQLAAAGVLDQRPYDIANSRKIADSQQRSWGRLAFKRPLVDQDHRGDGTLVVDESRPVDRVESVGWASWLPGSRVEKAIGLERQLTDCGGCVAVDDGPVPQQLTRQVRGDARRLHIV